MEGGDSERYSPDTELPEVMSPDAHSGEQGGDVGGVGAPYRFLVSEVPLYTSADGMEGGDAQGGDLGGVGAPHRPAEEGGESRGEESVSLLGGKACLLIRKHYHFTPTREIRRPCAVGLGRGAGVKVHTDVCVLAALPPYTGTSPKRKRPPPQKHHRALGTGLL